MKKTLVVIGNSLGLIIDKKILELYSIDREVEITPTEGGLLIRPAGPSLQHAAPEAVKSARESIHKRYAKSFKDLA